MKSKNIISLIIIFIFSITSSAQNMCASIFNNSESMLDTFSFKNIRLMEVSAESMNKSNGISYTKNVVTILNMLGQTKNLNFSEKLSEGKGELYLGHKLSNGASVEFFYTEDKRSESPSFVLSEVYYVKSNGMPIRISKEALTEDGYNLKNNSYIVISEQDAIKKSDTNFFSTHAVVEQAEFKKWLSTNKIEVPKEFSHLDFSFESSFDRIYDWISGLSTTDQNKFLELTKSTNTIEVPTVIKGDLYLEIKNWADRIEVLSHEKLRSVTDKNSVKWLLLEAEVRKLYNAIQNVIKKQSIKLVLFGLAGYFAATLNSDDEETAAKLKKLKNKVSQIEEKATPAPPSPELTPAPVQAPDNPIEDAKQQNDAEK